MFLFSVVTPLSMGTKLHAEGTACRVGAGWLGLGHGFHQGLVLGGVRSAGPGLGGGGGQERRG